MPINIQFPEQPNWTPLEMVVSNKRLLGGFMYIGVAI